MTTLWYEINQFEILGVLKVVVENCNRIIDLREGELGPVQRRYAMLDQGGGRVLPLTLHLHGPRRQRKA